MSVVHDALYRKKIAQVFFFFFFSSRRRHTRCSRDWSSDVCSSDLGEGEDGQALRDQGLEPIALEAKEGLAFVNGTQAQTGLAALLVHDAWVLWRTAHGAAAMSLEAVRGTPDPFDVRVHDARPHPHQRRSAE